MPEGAAPSYVLGGPDSLAAPLRSVGTKAATLARLAGEGIPVPHFSVVTSAALALHVSENRIPWPSPAEISRGPEAWPAVRDRIRAAPVPPAVSRPVLRAYDRLSRAAGHRKVAVRSSGGEEDSASASFAGQFDSILSVQGPVGLLEALKACWASVLSDRSLRYRATHGLPLGPVPSFGVIVQVQVLSQRAGVLFTVHPLEATRETAYIEANFGTGESVVGGLVTPDAITISRSTGEVIEAATATKRRMTSVSLESHGSAVVEVETSRRNAPVLTAGEARAILRTGLRIERLLEAPQDVEWAYDARQLWILQSRPITGPGRGWR